MSEVITVFSADEVLAEQDLAHLDRIRRPRRLGHRPHEGLVGQRHVREQHVEVALVHRDVGRLADRAARMVQPFRHVGQFHELLEIGDRRIAAAAIGVAHEGRAIDRRQHQAAPADLDVALGVAGVLDVAATAPSCRVCAPDRVGMRTRSPSIVGAGVLPKLQRRGIIDEVDADLFQDGLGVAPR